MNTFELRKQIRIWNVTCEEEDLGARSVEAHKIAEKIYVEFDKLLSNSGLGNNQWDLIDSAQDIFQQFPKIACTILRVADSV